MTNRPRPIRSAAALPDLLPVAAAFCGSACLFLIELVAGKWLLPQFGGAPGVWISCLAFFQTALVGAYFYSHRLIRLVRPSWQVALQTALFAAVVLVAPRGFAARFPLDSFGTVSLPLAVILVLAVTVGPAFFVIATLAPLLGHWSSLQARRPEVGAPAGRQVIPGDRAGPGDREAYALYAAGNAGSFGGLVAYPLLIEPAAGLSRQAEWLAGLYLVVASLTVAGGCWLVGGGRSPLQESLAPPLRTGSAVSWSTWLRWTVLAALPSSWLASITTHATVEIAPIPLLWIVPLGLYLASFVVVFAPGGRRLRRFEPAALLVAVGIVAWMLACSIDDPAWPVIAAHCAAFFTVCVALHGMLVDDRPAPEQITGLYLAMAVGGAIGGLGNALVAPLVFDANYEFPLVVAIVAGLMPGISPKFAPAYMRETAGSLGARSRFVAIIAAAVLLLATSGIVPGLQVPRIVWIVLVAVAVGVSLVVVRGWGRAVAIAVLLLGFFWLGEEASHVIHRQRTFFGVLRVREEPNGPSRQLIHGNISHGVQLVSPDPGRRRIPLSYYHQTGPLGSIFQALSAKPGLRRIGVAGLGIGTIATYLEPGQECVFFEIDPEVVRIATNPRWFTYLADCRGRTRVVVDDARKSLEREPDAAIDLLVVDAFTGDSVPTHLLTREALGLYGRKISADGVVAIHISNKYLDFVPIIEALATDGGWMALDGHDLDVPAEYARVGSHWVALSRSLDTIKSIYVHPTSDRWQWQPLAEQMSRRPWTDDRNAVAEALR